MTQYAAETKVPIEKTRAEIESTVRRYGADAFISGWEGDRASVQFRCHGRYVKLSMVLPARSAPEFATTTKGNQHIKSEVARSRASGDKLWDQACRQKWRALALMIKAKLEAIESGIVTFEEEFLAHVVMPDGRTVYEHAKGPLQVAYDSGQVRLLFGGPG